MTDNLNALVPEVQELLVAAMDRQPEAAGAVINRVAETHGHNGVYLLCCAVAAAIQHVGFPTTIRDVTSFAEIQNIGGEPLDEASPDLWAARFVAAHINGDVAMKTALFFGPVAVDARDTVVANVAALVSMGGDVLRLAEAARG